MGNKPACHGGKFYSDAAAQSDIGFRVEHGKGDHDKIFAPAGQCQPGERPFMTVPLHKELDKGLECAIRKWLKRFGLSLGALVVALIFAYVGFGGIL